MEITYRFLIINLGNSLRIPTGVHIMLFSTIPEFIPFKYYVEILLNGMSVVRIEVSDIQFYFWSFD